MLGYVGKNVVAVHKKQIFRCAPEHVRAATSEEASLATPPQLELLGIKNLVESGSLQSRQYVDLVPLGLPPAQRQSEDAVMSGRALAFQLIAYFRWRLMLGDIKGAFLSSGETVSCHHTIVGFTHASPRAAYQECQAMP